MNATLINATNQTFVQLFKEQYAPTLLNRLKELITAPYHFSEMLWIVVPLIVVLLIMEFYFGRYKQEELGWNTAVGNGTVLIFVGIDLIRHLYSGTEFSALLQTEILNLPAKTIIAIIIGLLGLFLMMSNFFHIIPKKIAFFISSALPINLIGYISIVLIYTNMPIDWFTLIASVILFVGLIILFGIIHAVIPKQTVVQKIREEVFEEKPEETNIEEPSERVPKS